MISLLAANVFTIIVAFQQNWNVYDLMWVYWLQSIIIGIFQVIKILTVKKFTTEGFTSNGKPVPPTQKSKKETAIFFVLHYGLFHLVYAGYLSKYFPSDIRWFVLAGVSFAVSSFVSYQKKQIIDVQKVKNLGHLLFQPYVRIIPMHLVIVFGGLIASKGNLLFFLILKSLIDMASQKIEESIRG